VEPVTGGDINEAARLTTERSRYLVKWNPAPLPRIFACEAQGLELLAQAGAIRVPTVYGYGEPEDGRPGFIVMEWLEPPAGGFDQERFAVRFGRQLAALHRMTASSYGLDHDNYIGSLPQPNGPMDRWVDFYRERRLGFQAALARRRGHLSGERARRMERLMARLERWIDEGTVSPSLLHGDLWSGNYIVGPQGEPVLIDPAVYYGHREVELAFTELFGGFPERFYRAYEEAFPLDPGYEERRPLYQLYYLLVHLNLFGEAYGGAVDRILRRYGGS